MGASGALFGTTLRGGGPNGGFGTVFKLPPFVHDPLLALIAIRYLR